MTGPTKSRFNMSALPPSVGAAKLAEALEGLIKANEEHNAAIMAIIGKPTGWTDGYLEPARTALAEWKESNQPTTKS